MDQDELARHAWSFGAAAVAYAEHRPDYAQAAVRWALEAAPGRSSRPGHTLRTNQPAQL